MTLKIISSYLVLWKENIMPYNEESYYEPIVSSEATTFAGSLFKLEKGLEKGKKYVKK